MININSKIYSDVMLKLAGKKNAVILLTRFINTLNKYGEISDCEYYDEEGKEHETIMNKQAYRNALKTLSEVGAIHYMMGDGNTTHDEFYINPYIVKHPDIKDTYYQKICKYWDGWDEMIKGPSTWSPYSRYNTKLN